MWAGAPRGRKGGGRGDRVYLSQLPFWSNVGQMPQEAPRNPQAQEGRDNGSPFMPLGPHQEGRAATPDKFLAKLGHWNPLATKTGRKRPLNFYPGTPNFCFSSLLTLRSPGLLPQRPPEPCRAGAEEHGHGVNQA